MHIKLRFSSWTLIAITSAALATLAGCGGGGGGGGGSGGGTPPIVNVSPGGLWEGGDQSSGLQILGIITETGEARFLRSDGGQYSCKVTTSGNSASCNYIGIELSGWVYPDGTTYGTGTLTGTIQAAHSFNLTTDFTTHAGGKISGTGALTFNAAYNRGSALATIAGNYLDNSNNAVVNVNSDGVLFEQNPTTGCVANGQVSIIDSKYNVYRVQYSFSNCVGSSAYLNNLTVTGLAVMDTIANPNVLIMAVSNPDAHYAWTAIYPKN